MKGTNFVFTSEFGPFFANKFVMRKRVEVLRSEEPLESGEDLYFNIRGILRVGQFLGLVSINDLSPMTSSRLTLRWKSFWTGVALVATIAAGVNGLLNLMEFAKLFKQSNKVQANVIQIAVATRHLLLTLSGFLIYLYLLIHTKKLTLLLKSWRRISIQLNFKSEDIDLTRSVKSLSSYIIISTLFGDLLYNCTMFPIVEPNSVQMLEEQNLTVWRIFARRSQYIRSESSLSNEILYVFQFVTNKLAYFAWNYTDLVIILFCRALSNKFRMQVQGIYGIQNSKQLELFQSTKSDWIVIRRDHLALCKLTDEIEEFLSPLIFVSFAMNTYSICLDIHEALAPTKIATSIEMAFATWSFAHLLVRVGLITYFGARVNDGAHGIISCIQSFATYEYCTEMERLEIYLRTRIVGLTGFNCFVLTRAFILVILSVLFTLEIVLIQASATVRAII